MRLHVKILVIFCSLVQLMQCSDYPRAAIASFHAKALQYRHTRQLSREKQSISVADVDSDSSCGTASVHSSPEPEPVSKGQLDLMKKTSFECLCLGLQPSASSNSLDGYQVGGSPLKIPSSYNKFSKYHPTHSPSDHGTNTPSDCGATPVDLHGTSSPSDAAGATPARLHPTKTPSDAGSSPKARRSFSRRLS